MRKILDWTAGNGHTLIFATIAFLAGMIVMLPLGLTLPESAAALIGAIVGAVATIGGALLLWRVQERQRTQHLTKAIAMQFGEVLHGSFELISKMDVADRALGDPTTHRDFEKQVQSLESLARDLSNNITRTRKKLERYSSSLHLLTSDKVSSFIDAETTLDTMELIAQRVSGWFVPGAQSVAAYTPMVIRDARNDLITHYNALGELLEQFAPSWSDED